MVPATRLCSEVIRGTQIVSDFFLLFKAKTFFSV